MRAVQFDRHGEPREVLRLADVPSPPCGPGQARVRMLYSPINPSDLLRTRGVYGTMAQLPASPGFEGVGIVEEVKSAMAKVVLGVKPGRRVVVLNQESGNWREEVVVPALRIFPVPQALPDEQAAGFFVNPATAWLMVTEALRVPPGAWLLQTAAGSAVGKMVIRLGKRLGFRTINVVRRPETAETLRRLGADLVVDSTHESIVEVVGQATAGAGAGFGLDPVGGPATTQVIQALGSGGKLLLYGSLDWNLSQFHSRHLIQNGITIQGFALQRWTARKKPLQMLMLMRKLAKLLGDGTLTTDIAQVFPLERFQDALAAAESPGRQGKILLKLR
jgi:NADPH2:quinone reductase